MRPSTIYLCPSSLKDDCQWEGKSWEIVPHFQGEHPDLLADTKSIVIDMNYLELNKLIRDERRVYLIQTESVEKNKRIVLKVRYLGSPLEASQINYYVEVSIGEYAFSSRTSFVGIYSPVQITNEGIAIDVDSIRLTCGKQVDILNCRFNFESAPEATLRRAHSKRFKESKFVKKLIKFDIDLEEICPDDDYFDDFEIVDEHQVINSNNTVDNNRDKRNVDDTYVLIDKIVEEPEEAAEVTEEIVIDKSVDDVSSNSVSRDKETFMEMMKCSSCDTLMLFPIYLCLQGHNVCSKCKTKACKNCLQSITDLRNIDLEDIAKNQLHPCRLFHLGCQTVLLGKSIGRHEVLCEFNLYQCPICPWWKKNYFSLEKHFEVMHFSTKILHTLKIPFLIDTTNLIMNDDFGVIYVKSSLLADSKAVEWLVQFCGSYYAHFHCEVTVRGKKNIHRTYALDNRGNNEHRLFVSYTDLKASGFKDKKTTLFIDFFT